MMDGRSSILSNLEMIEGELDSIRNMLDGGSALRLELSIQITSLRRERSLVFLEFDLVPPQRRAPATDRRRQIDRRCNLRGYDLAAERSRRGEHGRAGVEL